MCQSRSVDRFKSMKGTKYPGERSIKDVQTTSGSHHCDGKGKMPVCFCILMAYKMTFDQISEVLYVFEASVNIPDVPPQRSCRLQHCCCAEGQQQQRGSHLFHELPHHPEDVRGQHRRHEDGPRAGQKHLALHGDGQQDGQRVSLQVSADRRSQNYMYFFLFPAYTNNQEDITKMIRNIRLSHLAFL